MGTRPNAVEKAAISLVATSPSMTTLRVSAYRALTKEIESKFPGAIARAKDAAKKAAFDAKFEGRDIPPWVKTYVRKHAPDISRVVVWHRQETTWQRDYTGAHYNGWGKIHLTIGRDEDDARAALLHEIAHHHRPYAKHGDEFYDEFRRLLVAEGLLAKTLNGIAGGRGGTARGLRAAGRRARSAAA